MNLVIFRRSAALQKGWNTVLVERMAIAKESPSLETCLNKNPKVQWMPFSGSFLLPHRSVSSSEAKGEHATGVRPLGTPNDSVFHGEAPAGMVR